MFHEGEEDIPDECDKVNVDHAIRLGNIGEVDVLTWRPYKPIELEIIHL